MITANGCSDTIIQNVNVHYIPYVDFVVPEPCINGGTHFVDSSTVSDAAVVSWSWDFGDGTAADTNQYPIHQFATAGTYEITLTVASAYGCVNDTIIMINVLPGPTADFSMDPESGNPYQTIQFTDLSTAGSGPIIIWEWLFGDGDSAWIQNPSHSYEDEGEYPVELIVIDDAGCSDTTTKVLPIYHGPLVPSAFSPNGDDNNDFLMVLGGNFETVDFKVYNNWGEVIYETTDPTSKGWDGKYKDKEQPIGVYVYVAKVTTYDGEEHVLSGDVSLIR